MQIIKFKCKLVSDVIINQRAATEGNQETLDFIPGSAFLGIVANELYKNTDDENFQIFHSGKVRFGDAHPLENNLRGLRLPASLYFEKGSSLTEKAFIHHKMPEKGLKKDGMPVQVKQVRADFMVKESEAMTLKILKVDKSFAIKSSYDREKRRAKDNMMYGYEAIREGLVMGFEIVFENGIAITTINKVKEAITGYKKIGRSSSAQYGLVKIEEANYESALNSFEYNEGLLIYAESRLLFLDEYGMFTLMPQPKHFGIVKHGAEIVWKKSQVRTFRYAPYNSKRMQSDADRLCIEKGSVFFITGVTAADLDNDWYNKPVGTITNEGFGKILVNPEFLQSKPESSDGEALFSFSNKFENNGNDVNTSKIDVEGLKAEIKNLNEYDQPVFEYLLDQLQKETEDCEVYKMVNRFVNDPKKSGLFKKEKFASQWGTIRMKAMVAKDKNVLFDNLFKEPNGYLVHGVAEEKWKGLKIKVFKDYCCKLLKNEYKFSFMQKAIVNLAAEMAKKSGKENH